MNSGKRIDNPGNPDQSSTDHRHATRHAKAIRSAPWCLFNWMSRTIRGGPRSVSSNHCPVRQPFRSRRNACWKRKTLLEAFIELIAGAIDAKSPTPADIASACRRSDKMIADAACKADNRPFRDFNLSDNEREALHGSLAAAFDCSKVTTPEYRGGQGDKLETITTGFAKSAPVLKY